MQRLRTQLLIASLVTAMASTAWADRVAVRGDAGTSINSPQTTTFVADLPVNGAFPIAPTSTSFSTAWAANLDPLSQLGAFGSADSLGGLIGAPNEQLGLGGPQGSPGPQPGDAPGMAPRSSPGGTLVTTLVNQGNDAGAAGRPPPPPGDGTSGLVITPLPPAVWVGSIGLALSALGARSWRRRGLQADSTPNVL